MRLYRKWYPTTARIFGTPDSDISSPNTTPNKFFRLIVPDRCPFCHRTIPMDSVVCAKCRDKAESQTIEHHAIGGYPCLCAYFYKGAYAESIKKMKFREYPQNADKLAILMNRIIGFDPEEYDIITFVPMHPVQQEKRGYNQSELIARQLSKELNIPCEKLLIKIKNNRPQHDLKAAERKKNVKGVYQTVNPEKIKGKNILIIDDVITTGHTLGECCRMLEKAKAGKITCASVTAKIN